MNTKTALTKLTDAQRSTLDTYRTYMKEDYHGNGVKYRYSIYGYITALHEIGVLTVIESRLLKTYFTL